MNYRRATPCLTLIAALAVCVSGWAAELPKFNNLRFEEDWSNFDADSSERVLDRMKHIRLRDGVWLSTGGRARLRVEGWDNFNFDRAHDNAFMLYRLYLHTDWHFGEHWRVFAEGRFTQLTERDLPGGKRPALDVDRGDLWNVFVEGKFPVGDTQAMIRVGRQELQFGRQRLVSPLDWANNRRIFDAVLLRLTGGDPGWAATFFTSMPVNIRDDYFTWNKTDESLLFSGVYYTRPLGGTGHTLDAYLFAMNTVKDRPIEEDRYTVGIQAQGPLAGNLGYNVEGAYQLGKRAIAGEYRDVREDIRAWMVTAETTYTFADTWGRPWITLGGGYASGDRSPTDGRHETFRQLFPLGHAYLGYIDAIGRQNIIDARLSAGFWPVKDKLRVQADFHGFWLARNEDALYNVGGGLARSPIITTEGGRVVNVHKHSVGQELDLSFLYTHSRHLTFHGGFSRFFTGSFLQATGNGSNVNFIYTQVEFTF